MSQGMTSFFKDQQSKPNNSTIHPNTTQWHIHRTVYIIRKQGKAIFCCMLLLSKHKSNTVFWQKNEIVGAPWNSWSKLVPCSHNIMSLSLAAGQCCISPPFSLPPQSILSLSSVYYPIKQTCHKNNLQILEITALSFSFLWGRKY